MLIKLCKTLLSSNLRFVLYRVMVQTGLTSDIRSCTWCPLPAAATGRALGLTRLGWWKGRIGRRVYRRAGIWWAVGSDGGTPATWKVSKKFPLFLEIPVISLFPFLLPNPSIYPSPLSLEFKASFFTNIYCMHICTTKCCVLPWGRPPLPLPDFLHCCWLFVELRPPGFIPIHLGMSFGVVLFISPLCSPEPWKSISSLIGDSKHEIQARSQAFSLVSST